MRRGVWILYVFVVGLALHNFVAAELYDVGLRGTALDVVSAWKEVLLALGVHLRPEEMIGDLTEAIARLERRIRLTDRRSRVSSSRSSPPRQSHKSNDDHR